MLLDAFGCSAILINITCHLRVCNHVNTGYYDDHRFRLAARDEVVEDEVGMALLDPASLIFAATVLKIKHGIAHLRLRIVARR